MNNFNIPPQIMQMLRSNGNPQQLAMSMLNSNAGNNAMLSNMLNMANNGRTEDVVNTCRNIIKSKGYDPDELMRDFQNKINCFAKQ